MRWACIWGVLSLPALMVGACFGAERGRDLFETGSSAGRDAVATLRGSGVEVPARLVACANCHGLRAEGRIEAGVSAPPLKDDLSFDMFERIVCEGVGREGKPLHPAMPVYRLTRDQVADLREHVLRLNGRMPADGVTWDEIRIGMATGPNSRAAAAVERVVRAAFDESNAQGGIFRRKLVLEARPSYQELKGATLAAIASFAEDWDRSGQPVIGPLSAAAAGPNVYTLMPSWAEQWSALCGYLAGTTPNGVRFLPARQRRFVTAIPACAALRTADGGAATIVFAGPEKELESVVRANPGREIATLHIAAGRSAFRLPGEAQNRLLIAYPTLPGSAAGDSEFPALQTIALGSARVLMEALKRAGRDLTQYRLRAALESLNDFDTGLLPPVSFGPGKRSGVRGVYPVRASGGNYVPVGDWITAKE